MKALKLLSSTPISSKSTIKGLKCCWNFEHVIESTEELHKKTEELIRKCRSVYDEIADLNFEQVNIETIKILASIDCEFMTRRRPLEFPQYVSADKDLCAASVKASKKLLEFDTERSMRKDIFDRVDYWFERIRPYQITPATKRYVERILKIGKNNGLHLDYETQFKIKTLRKTITELSASFHRNLHEENAVLEFSEAELEGLPEDFMKTLIKTKAGLYKILVKFPHFILIMKRCKIANTRYLMNKAYHSRCIETNTPILEQICELRQELSELLNYPNHASVVTEMLMARNPETVMDFLNNMRKQFEPVWEKEKEQMLECKRQECEEFEIEFDGKLSSWELHYYMLMVEEKLYYVDQNKLKEFFPLEAVLNSMLQFYQTLLGLKFNEINTSGVWNRDVRMFKVEDAMTEELLGYFFLDLFTRDGKPDHTTVFVLQPGCLDSEGDWQVAISALVANFSKSVEDRPSLLEHKEVEALFHEFGHIMHHLCSKSEFALFSGKVERDFMEAPSQMLENFAWDPETLRLITCHYKTLEPLPMDMIEKLIETQNINSGFYYLQMIILAMFDQQIHQNEKIKTQVCFNELYEEILGILPDPSTNTPASFIYLLDGYDGQYYSYLWSEVYSKDMFYTRFKEEDNSQESGIRFRKCILEPGGSLDASDMLMNFLEREPNQDAFLKSKGLLLS